MAWGLYVHTSQSVSRLPISLSVPTPCTRMMVHSYGQDTLLSPFAVMRFLGWPLNLLPAHFSASQFRTLAGHGFSVLVSGMLMVLLYRNPHAPWWHGELGQLYGLEVVAHCRLHGAWQPVRRAAHPHMDGVPLGSNCQGLREIAYMARQGLLIHEESALAGHERDAK